MPFLSGKTHEAPHKKLFWRNLEHAALRMGDWKIHRHKIKKGQSSKWALYNLKDDIGETSDRAMKNPEKLKQLILEWEKQNKEMVEPLW